jgi:hypothetical protein
MGNPTADGLDWLCWKVSLDILRLDAYYGKEDALMRIHKHVEGTLVLQAITCLCEKCLVAQHMVLADNSFNTYFLDVYYGKGTLRETSFEKLEVS